MLKSLKFELYAWIDLVQKLIFIIMHKPKM